MLGVASVLSPGLPTYPPSPPTVAQAVQAAQAAQAAQAQADSAALYDWLHSTNSDASPTVKELLIGALGVGAASMLTLLVLVALSVAQLVRLQRVLGAALFLVNGEAHDGLLNPTKRPATDRFRIRKRASSSTDPHDTSVAAPRDLDEEEI